MVTASVTAGLGFLAGILWLDLIFDVQLLTASRNGAGKRDSALASVTSYYRHATGGTHRMDRFIAVVMVATLIAIVVQWLDDAGPDWVSWTSLVATAGPIALAATHTVPTAIKLGATTEDASDQRERLARAVLRDHLLALTGIVIALVVQLAGAH